MQYQTLVRQHAMFFCKNQELAKDIQQEVFIKLWKHKEKLDRVDDMRPYIFTIIRNLAYDHQRQQQKEQLGKLELLMHYRQFYPPPENERYDEKVFEQVYMKVYSN